MQTAKVVRIMSLALTVGDLDAARRFYGEALGFEETERKTLDEAAVQRLTGLVGARADVAVMRLGGQEIELTAFTPHGRPYPQPCASNDPWFQHFAIAVRDMAPAYDRLAAHPHTPISRGGPQRLPPSTGSVTAYKFRDPDGHPLELSQIPDSAWSRAPGDRIFLGVDHTALAVADLQASVDFYTRTLGLHVTGQFLNRGPEQDRLDGLDGVELDIVTLSPPEPGPHIELLHYRRPAAHRRLQVQPDDIAATRTRMAAADSTLTGQPSPSEGPARIYDPDGHSLELIEGAVAQA